MIRPNFTRHGFSHGTEAKFKRHVYFIKGISHTRFVCYSLGSLISSSRCFRM